jgi:hypothetical protein
MFKQYLVAGYPMLFARTLEPFETETTFLKEAQSAKFKFFGWDINRGIRTLPGDMVVETIQDPLGAVEWFNRQPPKSVLFVHNFHLFMGSPEVIQAVQNGIATWKSSMKTLVVLSSIVRIPDELQRLVTILNIPLPDREGITEILSAVAKNNEKELPENINPLLDAAMGMTAFEAENAFALSLTTHRKFVPRLVFSQKAQLLEKSATLELSSFTERFSDLGGLDNLKAFSRRIAGSELARGILLVGVPGCGKSLFAKALGNELGIPTISMDFGRMFGSKVGESEERIRHAMNVVDAMSPCVLFIDELEKGIGGIASSNQSDGGTGSRVFGTFLTWLNDHKSRVFVVATTNNISQLPPEFLRAERWDGIFFVDLPTLEEQKEILGMHRKAFNLSEQETPDLTGWSGAEIRSMCRIAAMMDSSLKEAAKYIVPLSKSMPEQLDTLSKWAKTRAIPASKISLQEPAQAVRRRVVQTEEN